jgi:hypothetical protein
MAKILLAMGITLQEVAPVWRIKPKEDVQQADLNRNIRQ